MVEIEDLDSYRRHNDIAPDDPAPREPEGRPDAENELFRVWLFDAEHSETVPDLYVVAQDPEPLDFRMWVFVGREDKAYFTMRASHRYSPEEAAETDLNDCCEVLLEGQSLSAEHCPESVEQLARDLSGAEVVLPQNEPDHGGPINY
jgi:hypothetical protein